MPKARLSDRVPALPTWPAGHFRQLRRLPRDRYTGRMPAWSAEPQRRITIREAFPALPEGMDAEAEARLARYLALVYRLYERIRDDPRTYAVFQQRLTELSAGDSMDSSGALRLPRALSS